MAISRLPAPLRLLILVLGFVVPPAALGWAALRPFGAVGARVVGGAGIPLSVLGLLIGIQVGWTALLVLALRAEGILARAFGATQADRASLGGALGRVASAHELSPSLGIFVDPRPAALVARSLG